MRMIESGLREDRGFSLIEVLIAIVILSLGVLAVASLQLVSKRGNMEAQQRTVAAQAVYDMIERMRANSSSDALQRYWTLAPARAGLMQAQPAPACGGTGSRCSPLQLASYDLWQWQQQWLGAAESVVDGAQTIQVGGLVSPTGCIDGPSNGSSGVYTVTLAWRSKTAMTADADSTCGLGATDAAGGALYGSNDEYRRTVSISAFIAQK